MGKACCFVGHRKTEATKKLIKTLTACIEELIEKDGVDTFYFGSRSQFDTLCLKTVSALQKEKYPFIKRINIRAEYPDITREYEEYLSGMYERSFFPKGLRGSGRAVYVERNREMIERSDVCVFYYKEDYLPEAKQKNEMLAPKKTKSGTALAFDFAKRKNKRIINVI